MQKLNVQLLGDFALEYDGKRIWLGNSYKTKVFQLLQILLYHGVEGITTSALIDQLYGQDAEGDTANNLRVTVYNLRRLLEKSELPQEHYVRAESGRYRFVAPSPVEVDALQFEALLEDAQETADQEEKFRLLKEALDLYGGHFLSDLSGEEWVAVASAHYEHLFSVCMNEMADLLRDAEDYELLLSYFVRAVKLYPFDEWQIGQMECLLEMGRTREAMHIYDKISKLYFEELGLPPSEKMKDCFARMSKMLLLDAEGFQEIHNALKEKADPEGAYYCSYPGFVDAYRVLNRVLDRMNQSVFLMLCTITDVRDREIENKERLKNISEKLGQAIQGALRKGDVYTRYSANQYLVLLMGISKENCTITSGRIDTYFRKRETSRRIKISYRVVSIRDSDDKVVSENDEEL